MDFDVAVIGAGPAGIQAAIHSSRKKASTVVLGKSRASAAYGTRIENYLGTGGIEGSELLAEGRTQAESTGAVFVGQDVIAASGGDRFSLTLEDGKVVTAKAVVLATGISRKKLGVPGEKELFGKGVSYCAVCDCNFYKGKRVAVVGNDSEAAVSAELMTKYASETHWIAWDMGADEALVCKAVAAGARIYASELVSISGDGKVSSIELEDGSSIPVDGVFIELGAKSSDDLAMDLGAMPEIDDTLKVSADCSTDVPGLFACGDVAGKPWQVAKAVGQGCVAGMSAADYARGAQ